MNGLEMAPADSRDVSVFLRNANEYWSDRGYEILLTADESPTLKPLLPVKSQSGASPVDDNENSHLAETMHHRGGAFSETQLIYGEALAESFNNYAQNLSAHRLAGLDEEFSAKKFSVLSIGLGLAYNEILVATHCLRRQIPPQSIYLESFEKDCQLVSSFTSFFRDKSDESGVYRYICEYFVHSMNSQLQGSDFTHLTLLDIQNWLTELYQIGNLQLRESLDSKTVFNKKFNVIFYDAFSSKTNPELWDETFLSNLWERVSAESCVVSTYACTGSLKRSLKKQGFSLQIKQGFQSKRDRTYAVKIFK